MLNNDWWDIRQEDDTDHIEWFENKENEDGASNGEDD